MHKACFFGAEKWSGVCMVVVKYNKGCMIFVFLQQLGLVKCR